ncbi:hypothetical protein UFOVP312_43 [uncultured Caudovirales phage]|uniref:Uncharacterized protein n=1 Tax=uncultured Caudovirales phage TaxID=2100421 RepID=A0A6J5LUN6_9CAUD|nr:hypothetical protein UFOVP312_43 [uncultured Caudovirales phage]
MSKPSLRDLVESTGAKIDDWFYNYENPQYAANQKLLSDASSALYGNVGANMDTRDWNSILTSDNTIQAANDALAAMYSDPAYREANTANLVAQKYDPAQAFYTYNQMNDRVGATYVPTLDEVNAVNNYFQKLGVPDVNWSFDNGKLKTNTSNTAKTSTVNTSLNTGTGGSAVNQISAGSPTVQPQVMGPTLSGIGGWNARQSMGGANGSLMGAGSADYNSSLIKSLRQNSMTPFSTNPGVVMAPNQGSTNSNWAQPSTPSVGAFNPQVLNPRAASPQEIDDWNAYSSYRTNSLTAKTPIVSFAEWLAGGKANGQAPTNTTPPPDYQYDPSLGGG